MKITFQEKKVLAVRALPFMATSLDPGMWKHVFTAEIDKGKPFEEAVETADAWVGHRTREFRAVTGGLCKSAGPIAHDCQPYCNEATRHRDY